MTVELRVDEHIVSAWTDVKPEEEEVRGTIFVSLLKSAQRLMEHELVNYPRLKPVGLQGADAPHDWPVDDACRPSPCGRKRVLRHVAFVTVFSLWSAFATLLAFFLMGVYHV